MAKLLSIIVFTISTFSMAHNTSLSEQEGELKQLSADDIRARLEIRGEVFFFDKTGNRLLFKSAEWRRWTSRFGNNPIESNWGMSSQHHAPLAFHHTWTVNESGQIEALIEQYSSIERKPGNDGGVEYGKLLGKESFVVKDFAPINWVSLNEKKYRMVVVFTPSLKEENNPQSVTELALSGKNMVIADSQGTIWTTHVAAKGKYLGIVTHKGSLLMSYYAFKGSKPIGVAQGNTIEIPIANKLTATVMSAENFVPKDTPTTIHAQYLPDIKTSGLSSTRVNSSDKEEQFLAHVDE